MEGTLRKIQPATFCGWTKNININNTHYFWYYLPEINNYANEYFQPVDGLSSNLQIVLRSLTIFLSLGLTHNVPTHANLYQDETEQSVLSSDNYNTSKQNFCVYCPFFWGYSTSLCENKSIQTS
jgi:hypothetical protein